MSETAKKGYPDRFATIDNRLLEDPSISWQAKGLQAYLISRPDNWKISSRHLASIGIGGIDKIQSILRELQSSGYIHREEVRDKLGRIGYVSWIYQHPGQNNRYVQGLSVTGKPDHGKSGNGKHSHIISTERTSTKQVSTERKITSNPESKAKFSEPETKLQASNLNPLQDSLNLENESTYQNTSEGITEGILDTNQTTITHYLDSNLIPSGEKDLSAARVTEPDKPNLRDSQRARAGKNSLLQRGIENDRWSNLEQFKKFRAYVEQAANDRLSGITAGRDGVVYDANWVEGVIVKTANCKDDKSADLQIWTAWQTEIPAPPLFVAETEPANEIPDEIRALVAAFFEKNRLEREQREIDRTKYDRSGE